jgi:hypothetical protein
LFFFFFFGETMGLSGLVGICGETAANFEFPGLFKKIRYSFT